MSAKRSSYKTFQLDKDVSVECNYYETRYSWGHEAELWVNGRMVETKKITYYNRTWEAYTYQTILESIVSKYKGFTKEQAERYTKIIRDDSFSQDKSMGKTVAMVAMMGEVFGSNQKEKNDWKARMIKAGLPGVEMPEDWETLTEEEKETRLDKVIAELRK